jgi:hypothetical protein
MSINNFTISPDTQNRQSNTACGLQNVSSGLNFNVSCLTSGNPDTVGFAIQGGVAGGLLTGPLDTMRLWIDDLATTSDFNIRPTGDLNLSPVTTIINVNDTLLLDETDTINKKTTISAGSNKVEDTINGPLGDPIYTEITPNLIYFQNGNGTDQSTSVGVNNINLTNNDAGFFTDIGVSSITISDTSATQLNTITNSSIQLQDSNLGFNNNIDASSITCTNWSIDSTGLGTFTTLTVDSIALVTTLSLTGTTLNIPLGGHAIDKSWAITINNNVTVLNPTTGITGGVYKLWLTVGSTPRTFSKACGVVNNLLGDTLMAANSIWLIEIYKRSSSTYRAIFTNFT